jgi:hypothetical protein
MKPPDKRFQFFLRQSEACTRLGGPPDGCWCPLCGAFFTRADLDARRLTIEHVPPRSIGGKAMCLTCAACNNTAGSKVDASVSELARIRKLNTAFFGDKGDYTGPMSLSAGGIDVNAELHKMEGQPVRIDIHERSNHPERFGKLIKDLQASASSGTDWQFGLSAQFRTNQKRLFASLLRSGYLTAFSLFGYRYAGIARLNVVRQQIREPDIDHIPRIGICFNNTPALDDGPMVAVMTAPFPGVVVYFPAMSSPVQRPTTVLLPSVDGPEDFYQAIVDAAQGPVGRRTFNFTVEPCACPTGPALSCDFAEPSTSS